jgi:excisionase family DNA binding protein
VPGSSRSGTAGATTKAVIGLPSEPPDIPLAQVQFLTVAEVASMMRVSKMTVYRLVHAGDLPAARVGRSFRVPRAAVEDYLRNAYFDAG